MQEQEIREDGGGVRRAWKKNKTWYNMKKKKHQRVADRGGNNEERANGLFSQNCLLMGHLSAHAD